MCCTIRPAKPNSSTPSSGDSPFLRKPVITENMFYGHVLLRTMIYLPLHSAYAATTGTGLPQKIVLQESEPQTSRFISPMFLVPNSLLHSRQYFIISYPTSYSFFIFFKFISKYLFQRFFFRNYIESVHQNYIYRKHQ